MSLYPYAGHDDGIVLDQPRCGEFTKRPMTPGELAAREPAYLIAKDIFRHANQAGVCYSEIWRLIADVVDTALREKDGTASALPEAALTDFEQRTRNAAESAGVDWMGDDPGQAMLDEINALRKLVGDLQRLPQKESPE